MANFEDVLSQFGKQTHLYARLINTFSLLEYIGSRKIIKSQIDRKITLEVLGHISEEIRHAQILKHLALKLSDQELSTYQEEHLIAGVAARTYIQTIDRSVEKALPIQDEWVNYLLTTFIIEERAALIYPLFDTHLSQLGIPAKLSSIVRDETQHLKDVTEHLKNAYLDMDTLIAPLQKIEAEAFGEFMQAILEQSH